MRPLRVSYLAVLAPFFSNLITVTVPQKHRPSQALTLLGWLLPFLLLPCLSAQAGVCALDRAHETGFVERVFDGDTIRLRDGRSVRLIGINTPEIDHHSGTAEPFARQARERLAQLIGRGPVRLRFDEERRDRYGRQLAHVFNADGVNLTEQLIREGFGFFISLPPNLWQADCYSEAENFPRLGRMKIWGDSRYTPGVAATLPANSRGFLLVEGRVTGVRKFPSGTAITLDGRVSLFVQARDEHYFPNLAGEHITGKRVTSRGWVYPRKGKPNMKIRHPSALQWQP